MFPVDSLIQQTAATATTTAAQGTTAAEIWTGFIIAIATLVSGVSGLLVHFVNSPRIKAVAQLAKTGADKTVEAKQDIATLAKVTYDMLPEESKQITNAQNVRIAALEEKLNQANQALSALKNQVK